jgi:uncharacterized protein YdeI (YjbR/CyaY-like superfamily)
MGKKDPRIDAYIAKSAEFARPILSHLRKLVHAGCPDVQETMKWSFPHFEYQGVLCSMAAFKAHATFGFWKSSLMKTLTRDGKPDDAMGQYGRITSLDDLPSDKAIIAQVKEAARLNAEGIKAEKTKTKKPPLKVPSYFQAALKKDANARATFANLSPSHKREYVEWITEAKTDATRQKRLATTLQWLAAGKSRNWKYERKSNHA